MPKLKPSTQAQRREHILDAAERCFARSGFHSTTMHDICREAGVSPGALYVYFASKELLISGLCERDRADLQERLAVVAEAPDLLEALRRLGDHYVLDQPDHKRTLWVEIAAEATRNPKVAKIFRDSNAAVQASFHALFGRAAAEGRIAPRVDIAALNAVLQVIGDGLFFRRAVDPSFDARATMPAVLAVIAHLMQPQDMSLPSPAGMAGRKGGTP